MKKIWLSVGISLFILAGCAPKTPRPAVSETNDQWAMIQKAGVLVVGTEGTYRPMTYHDEKDELVGFEVDVAKALAAKLGLKVKFVEAAWDALLAGLDAGRLDTVINEVSPSTERRKKYDFTEEYTFVHGVAITSKDNHDIHSFADLAGKRSAQTLSSSWAQVAEKNGADIVSVTAFRESIEMILSGRADTSLNSELAFYTFLEAQPEMKDRLKIAAESTDVITTAIPVRKGETRFLTALNEALKALQEEGTLRAISQKYFARDITVR